jgi:hypothetical protein
MMRREGRVGEAFIRQAAPPDIKALVDIYIECFPERVNEVFGGPHRRAFIRDYLRFYLARDPLIIGFILLSFGHFLSR